MLRIGLIGCGRIGKVHARSISSIVNAELVAVADAVSEAADRLREEFGVEVREAEAILADPNVEAVVIASPTTTHFDLIQGAVAARKAILCEKPVDMSTERIRKCMRAIEDAGILFMTGFNRRFDRNFAQLQQRLREGEIGDVEVVSITSRDPAPPPASYVKTSGGLFRDMMIHDFDMARFLLDEEPIRLQAVGSVLIDPGIGEAGDVDTAAVMLTTASGRICQISNSRRASYGYDQRVEVHGSKGLLRADNQLDTTIEVGTSAGFRRARAQHFFLERYRDAYLEEMKTFVTAVHNEVNPSPGIQDGFRAQMLADAATEACQQGTSIIIDEQLIY